MAISEEGNMRFYCSGSVFFNKAGPGYGSVYTDDGKTVTWVCNFNPGLQNEIIYLQPGRYKLVFRLEFSKETIKTVEKNFEVKSGTPLTVKLF